MEKKENPIKPIKYYIGSEYDRVGNGFIAFCHRCGKPIYEKQRKFVYIDPITKEPVKKSNGEYVYMCPECEELN